MADKSLSWRKSADWYFKKTGADQNLGQASARGGLVSVGAQVIKFLSQILTLSILARILTPEDFGYIAMALVLISMLKMLAGQALSTGIIQHRIISREQVSGFFWISNGLCLVLTLAATALAPAMAWFFQENVLLAVVPVMAIQIMFAGLTASHLALMARTMQFGIIAGLDLAATLLSKILGIAAAIFGAGYWALVLVPISYDALRTLFVWFFCKWRPQFGKIPSSSKSLLQFGATLSFTSIIESLLRQIDRILIGKVWSGASLGLYSKSYDLGELPSRLINWPLERVALSALSKLQDNREDFMEFFFAINKNFLFFISPAVLFIHLASPQVIGIILGPQWAEAESILRYLSIVILLDCILFPLTWFFISTNQLKKYLIFTLLHNGFKVVAVFLGIKWGPVGVSISLIAGIGLFFPIGIVYTFSGSFLKFELYWKAIWRILVILAITGIMVHFIHSKLPLHTLPDIASAGIIGFITGCLYLLFMFLIPGGKEIIITAINTAQDLIKGRPTTA